MAAMQALKMRNGEKWRLGAVAGILFVGIALIIVHDYRQESKEPLVGDDFCPRDVTDLQSHTVFVLDFSDPVTSEYAEQIVANVTRYRRALPEWGKLTTMFITADSPAEIYAVCRPSIPKVRRRNWKCDEKLQGIDRSSQAVADRFCDFEKQMRELVADVVDRSKDKFPSSPLTEVLADVSARPNFRGIAKKEIVMFSDLLQNTDRYSFYRDRGPAPVARDVLVRENIDLTGAKIIVHQIQRKSHNPGFLLNAKTFWQELFNLARAETVVFHSIE